jgi:hypothetical protein
MALSSGDVNKIIAERKQRWVDFYDMSKPGRNLLLVRWMPALEDRPWPSSGNIQQRIEWAWKKYQIQLQQMEWLEDDTLPFLDVFTGTEIFAAAFGCPVYYPTDDMPFAMPRIKSASEVNAIQIPDLDTPGHRPAVCHGGRTAPPRWGGRVDAHGRSAKPHGYRRANLG